MLAAFTVVLMKREETSAIRLSYLETISGAISQEEQVPPGFHRLTFFFGLASVVVWFLFLNKWLGGEWWSLLLAIVIAIPVGVVYSLLPSLLFRTLRRLPVVSDFLLTSLFILGGIALAVIALITFEGTTLAMFVLSATELVVSGVGRFYARA